MENTRRRGIKDGYNEKTRKDSFTATERSCHRAVTESPKITRNQTVTPLNEVLSIEIRRRGI